MKKIFLLGLFAVALDVSAQSMDSAFDKAANVYQDRTAQAAAELTKVRERITAEKTPLLEKLRDAESRLVAAESELNRTETHRNESNDQQRKLTLELAGLQRNTSYDKTVVRDSLKGAIDNFSPGEDQLLGQQATLLLQRTESESGLTATGDAAEFLLARTQHTLGGYRIPGKALTDDSNEIKIGTFAFVGPESYFLPSGGGTPGVVRAREGSKFPISHSIRDWKSNEAGRFFSGQLAEVPLDPSGGKALKLRETSGTLWGHVQKGGVIAYAILLVGAFALFLIVQKILDLRQLRIANQVEISGFLELVSRGENSLALEKARSFKDTTGELFLEGLHHVDHSKAILEEKLEAVLLDLRLRYERRLPLLAVIATAAPLMGLLGTVVGMVRTFALITVFGTGNAARLASGISEVLVTTELGLCVAIPTLVAHGFLSHRIQKRLAQLERHALQFCTAMDTSRTNEPSPIAEKTASA